MILRSAASNVRTEPNENEDAGAFGMLLRRFRLSAGLSQEGLAEKAGLSADAVGMLERGIRRAPYATTVSLLSDALRLGRSDHEKFVSAVKRRRSRRVKRPLFARATLPVPLTALIGRERELSSAGALFRNRLTRLITITGPGGVGKTRFALQLAHDHCDAFEDGAVFVGLAAIQDPAHIVGTISECLVGPAERSARSLERLCARIGERSALFVLDNLEQVLAGARILCEFLERCPNAVILGTSREALRVQGECEFALPPLDLDASLALLRDRVRAVRPHLDVDSQQEYLRSICRRLDGLPLAIELSAGLLRHDPAETVLARLGSPLDALVANSRDVPARQRTIRDAFDWSYRLLTEPERTVFGILGLFAGGGSIEAVEAICASTHASLGDVRQVLFSLADKSLLHVRNEAGGQARFEMLETIRQYAQERLAARAASADYERAFASYHAALASRSSRHRSGSLASASIEAVSRDYENLRTVLRWCVTHERSFGLHLAVDLMSFWERKGYYAEALGWLDALAVPLEETAAREDPQMLWLALNSLGLAYYWAGDGSRACRMHSGALGLARQRDDRSFIARSLNNLGIALLITGEYDRARALLEESFTLKNGHDDTWSVSTTLGNLGLALRMCRDYDGALDCHRRARDLFRSIGHTWGELGELNFMGDVFRDRHEDDDAARCYEASLEANTERIPSALLDSMNGVITISARRGDHRRVAVLSGAVEKIRRETGACDTLDTPLLDAAVASARASLGLPSFEEARSEGGALSPAEASEVARLIAKDFGA